MSSKTLWPKCDELSVEQWDFYQYPCSYRNGPALIGTFVNQKCLSAVVLLMDCKGLERLEALRQKNADTKWVNRDLYRLFYRPDLYIAAYENLRRTPGVKGCGDGSAGGGLSQATIDRIIDAMRNESFQFTSVPRRPGSPIVGLSSSLRSSDAKDRDKVVLEMLRMILEAIYDSPYGSSFSQQNHGFRRDKGYHSALKEVRDNWSGVAWIIEGHAQCIFEGIDQTVLFGLLGERISDERFLNLIRKAVKAGYYEFARPVASIQGRLRGTILSPILSNIFLTELDAFAASLIAKYHKGDSRRCNLEYRSLQNSIQYRRHKIGETTDPDVRGELLKEVKRREKDLMAMPSAANDGQYLRVKYVRHTDCWLIGINGPKELAEQICGEIGRFLRDKLKLVLNNEDLRVRHAKTEESSFHGVRIKIGSDSPRVIKVRRKGHDGKMQIYPKRVAGWTPHMLAPVHKLVLLLKQWGFCTADGTPLPKKAWSVLDDDQIIAAYNPILWGILNYYSFVDNYANLTWIQHILHMSAALTLSMKHRRSVRKTFNLHKRDLGIVKKTPAGEYRVALGLERDWKKTPTRFHIARDPDPDRAFRNQLRIRTRSKLGERCIVCGSEEGIEMHHVTHLRTLGKGINGFHALLAKLKRRQVPLCQDCHVKIHAGAYDGVALSRLYDLNTALD